MRGVFTTYKRLARAFWWALLFFCALFQLGLVLMLHRLLPRFAIPLTALLYLASLAHLLFLIFRGGGREREILCGLILLFPLFGGMLCLVFGLLHRNRPPLVPPRVLVQGESEAVYFETGVAYFDALLAAIEQAEQTVY